MHASVMEWGKERLAAIGPVGTCLEVGSDNVNGSLRPFVQAKEYIGVDVRPGPGVDKVMDGLDIPMLGRRFDLVICTEVLEHAKHWAALVLAIKAVAQRDVLISTRSPGYPYHGEVYRGEDRWEIGDFWRFDTGDLWRAFADCFVGDIRTDPDRERPGVFLHARVPSSPRTGFRGFRAMPMTQPVHSMA